MLTRELAIANYDSGRVIPDRLTRHHHSHYVELIDAALDVYRNGAGRMRRDLHRNVHAIFADELDCPVRRINGFCKLLDEKTKYDRDRRGNAAKLRKQVFRLAGKSHPLVQRPDRLFESGEATVKHDIAEQMGKSWTAIERELFADIIPFHRQAEFEGYSNGAALLSRYNVAQCQAVLYDAISMTVWAGEDFKTILRYAKLARLMHAIERQSNGCYVFYFDGPVSVLRQSRRYGVALAKFLPSLLACQDWKMQANIKHRRSNWQNLFRLSPADGLKSNRPNPDLFDSSLEESFAKRWGKDCREGWTMVREGEVLHADQKVFVPDFLFQHESGARVLMEIIGFWTPEYLSAKLDTLKRFSKHDVLLAISEGLDWPGDSPSSGGADSGVPGSIRFKSSIRIADVLSCLDKRL